MLCYPYNKTFTVTHQHVLVNGLCHSHYASVSMHYPFCKTLVNILIYCTSTLQRHCLSTGIIGGHGSCVRRFGQGDTILY